MDDLLKIEEVNGKPYFKLLRPLEEKDFRVVSESCNSIRFIFDDDGWEYSQVNNIVQGTIKIRFIHIDVLDEILKEFKEKHIDGQQNEQLSKIEDSLTEEDKKKFKNGT